MHCVSTAGTGTYAIRCVCTAGTNVGASIVRTDDIVSGLFDFVVSIEPWMNVTLLVVGDSSLLVVESTVLDVRPFIDAFTTLIAWSTSVAFAIVFSNSSKP